MIVTVNGERRELPEATTLEELIDSVAGSTRGAAAAVDGEVVPRSQWPSYRVQAGEVIELITAVQGG